MIDRAPSSYLQEGLWFSEQISDEPGLLNLCISLRLCGQVKLACLREALDDLVKRHETLRTTFHLENECVVQQIHPSSPLEFEVVEVGELDEALQLARLESLRGFNLAHGPLIRARVFRIAAEDHVLHIAMHHIVCDQWSIDVLLRDMAELYTARVEGRGAELPALGVHYRDFAAAEREALEGPRLEVLAEFWADIVEGASRTLDLPCERPSSRQRTSVGESVCSLLPAPLVERLSKLARAERLTLFTLVLAAVRVLLWQHTGQRDILLGSPIAMRDDADHEDLVGLFVNMVVLRNSLSAGSAFRDVLRAEFARNLDAFEHRDMPYRKLVEITAPQRDASASPLFSTAVTFGSRDTAPLMWHEMAVHRLDLGIAASQFDLAISGLRGSEGAEFIWAFNDAVLDVQTVERLSERLEPLLEAIADDPDQPIAALRRLSERDASDLKASAATDLEPTTDDVVSLVNAIARDMPEATAVIQGSRRVPYSELITASEQVAASLAALSLPGESRVGLLLRRDPMLPAIMLGVLRAGLAFVPLDVDTPAARLTSILVDCGARVLVHTDGLNIPHGPWAVRSDTDLLTAARNEETVPDHGSHPGRLAYVLYTSGSTGIPKGVAVSHGALANCLVSTRTLLACKPDQRWLAVSRTAFDISLLEIFTPLVSGCELVLTTDEQGRDGNALRALLESCDPDFMQATPAMWQMLEDSGWKGSARLTVHTGGDVVPVALAERLIQRNGAFWHTYGPTEATLYCVATPLSDISGLQLLPIGTPIRGTDVCILDEDLMPVPPGVVGELCVSGVGLARGYLHQPALTADRFVPHPEARRPGERVYRTGDRALRRFDGRLELHGRIDHQIKIRGFRIELGEIENVLARHPAVDHAVVLRVGDRPETHRLSAFLRLANTVDGDADPSLIVADIRNHAKNSLPHYMLPADIHVLDRLPMTPNGKVDRERLVAIAPAPRETSAVAPTPGDAVTGALCAIFAKALGSDAPFSPDQDFFAAGGNSLSVMRLTSHVRDVLAVELTVRDVFEEPTPAGLTTRLSVGRDRALSRPALSSGRRSNFDPDAVER
ncbi:amino acid adenylation domain-containing protein [Nonomuraea sp. NPDC050556]|uniref:amino acid adenylation domain-containing protein n=1 Tax=Nonomuraea sp. NPDC050556 TaxID=3364369 RepID=UPI0037AE3A0E